MKLSESNAKAIQGLEPKISVWNTGSGGADGAGGAGPIGQIFKNLPPLIDTIYTQTGIRPPNWLANTDNMSSDSSSSASGASGASGASSASSASGASGASQPRPSRWAAIKKD